MNKKTLRKRDVRPVTIDRGKAFRLIRGVLERHLLDSRRLPRLNLGPEKTEKHTESQARVALGLLERLGEAYLVSDLVVSLARRSYSKRIKDAAQVLVDSGILIKTVPEPSTPERGTLELTPVDLAGGYFFG